MRKILNNDYALSLISKTFNLFFGFLSLIFLNRFLGTTLKGEYSSMLNYVTIISSVFQFGISIVYSKWKRKNIENCFEVFISLSLIQFAIYVLIMFILLIIFKFNIMVFWLLILTIISILTTQFRYINLVENIKKNTKAVITMSFVNFMCIFFSYIFLEKNVEVAYIIYLIKDVTIIIFLLRNLKFSKLFKKCYNKLYIKIIVSGIIPMLSNLLIMLNYKIDIVMLNVYKIDYSLIGLYSLGLSIAEYVWIIPDIFKDVVQKRIAKGNNLSSINFSLRISTTIVIMFYLLLLLFGKNLYSFIFGEEFARSYEITILLFVGIFSMIYYKIIGQLLIADNKTKQYFLILLVSVIINIIFNVILINDYNIMGAAIASVLSYSFVGIFFCIYYIKNYNVKFRSIIFITKDDINKILQFIKK